MSSTTDKMRARSGRLSLQTEKRFLEELHDFALAKCRTEVAKFAECAKANSWRVVFMCRQENKKMNSCLNKYTNEEVAEEFLEARRERIRQNGYPTEPVQAKASNYQSEFHRKPGS